MGTNKSRFCSICLAYLSGNDLSISISVRPVALSFMDRGPRHRLYYTCYLSSCACFFRHIGFDRWRYFFIVSRRLTFNFQMGSFLGSYRCTQYNMMFDTVRLPVWSVRSIFQRHVKLARDKLPSVFIGTLMKDPWDSRQKILK